MGNKSEAGKISVLEPNWSFPSSVHEHINASTLHACTTLRFPGASSKAFAEFNLATHVGDDEKAVRCNRESLRQQLALPAEPLWLTQEHGTHIVDARYAEAGVCADGSFATDIGIVCAILTADCLPVFLCSADDLVMVVHAGWRGLAAGILEKAVRLIFDNSSDAGTADLFATFGPAIGANAYEIGDDVRSQLLCGLAGEANAFRPSVRRNHWYANLYLLATLRLQNMGVHTPPLPDWCTYNDERRFFSHRREPGCGRMASLIWRS